MQLQPIASRTNARLRNRVVPKADPQTQALSLILREIGQRGEVSRNKLVSSSSHIRAEQVDGALATLVDVGVVKRVATGEKCRYTLKLIDEGGPKDFLILRTRKKVRVSPEGHRAVRLVSRVMAVKDKVTSRPCGSLIWSDKVSAPKYRLGPAQRTDPLSDNDPLDPMFEILKKESNDLAFRLNFDPPLFPGEVVDYGFYVWTKNYYAKTRREALEKYHDEWTREGMSVNDPSLFLEISVKLPEGHRYQEARAERNPVLRRDGPSVPGAVISKFRLGESSLHLRMEKPASGHYFVSWIPQE